MERLGVSHVERVHEGPVDWEEGERIVRTNFLKSDRSWEIVLVAVAKARH